MRLVDRRIVTAYIVSKDGNVLLGKKDPSKGGVYPESWHNPGGGVDVGETDEQAIDREILEETGLDVSQCEKSRLEYKSSGESEKTLSTGEKIMVKMQFNVFKIVLPKNAAHYEFVTHGDLVELKWFPIAEIEHINLTPPALELIAVKGIDWLS